MSAPGGRRLVDELAAQLEPVRRPAPPALVLGVWLAAGWAVVLLLTWLTGPFRPGAGEQLLGVPRFAFECLLGLGVGVAAASGSFALGTPGRPAAASLRAGAALAAAWIGLLGVGLLWPALSPSSVGARAFCDLQTALFAMPPLGLGLWALRRRATLDRRRAGLWLGLAAGSLPALVMQWACMYDPGHALVFHLGPVALVAVAGLLLAPRLLPRI